MCIYVYLSKARGKSKSLEKDGTAVQIRPCKFYFTSNLATNNFQVDDSELQDEPLQIRLMDYDTYSANDAIGKVYIDLNPLLLPAASLFSTYNWNAETAANRDTSPNSIMSGWIPVYDTMHGIRGEVNITVKVDLFSDTNKFRQSSCGVQFFCCKLV